MKKQLPKYNFLKIIMMLIISFTSLLSYADITDFCVAVNDSAVYAVDVDYDVLEITEIVNINNELSKLYNDDNLEYFVNINECVVNHNKRIVYVNHIYNLIDVLTTTNLVIQQKPIRIIGGQIVVETLFGLYLLNGQKYYFNNGF